MTGIARRVLRHKLAGILGSRLCASAAGMVVGIALARALGPAGLGDYAALVATAGIAGTLCCLGMEIPYNLAATDDPRGGGNLLMLVNVQAACALPFAGLLWLALDWMGNAPPDASPVLFALVTAAFVLNQLTQPVMSGLQKQLGVNFAIAGLLGGQAVAITLLSRQGFASMPVAAGINVAALALLGLAARMLHGDGRDSGFSYRATVGSLFGQGRHYMLATLSGVLRLRVGIVMMGWYLPASDIGNYQIMQTLTEVLYLIPVTVSTYVLSARMDGAALRREALRAALASVAITLLCVACLSLSLPFLVPFFYGPEFASVVVHGPLMLTGAVAFAIAKGISAYFSRIGQARTVTRVEVATALAALAAFAVLVPVSGLRGAVWSFIGASWFGAIAYSGLLSRTIIRKVRFLHTAGRQGAA